MPRSACLSLFLSSSTSPPKRASPWGNRPGFSMSRCLGAALVLFSIQPIFRWKISTMRNEKPTACSSNFFLSTSSHSLKLGSSLHPSDLVFSTILGRGCIYVYTAPAQVTTYHFFDLISFWQTPDMVVEKESSYPIGSKHCKWCAGCMKTPPSSLGILLALLSSRLKGKY